jgi:glycosyltransferase involved in cell wall biosynthesis
MRILVLLNSLYTGGAELSTLSFYHWLRKKDHDIKLVCVKKAAPSYDPADFGFQDAEYLKGNSFLGRLMEFNAIVNVFQPHLVHSVLFNANMIGRMSRVQKRNFIHLESLVNEMYSSQRLSDPHITRMKLEGYRLLDKITQRWGVDHFQANGHSVANHYQKKLGISSERICVINRGRPVNPFVGDPENRNQVRATLLTGDRLLILQVGRHEFQKGQDVLVDAVARLGEWRDKIQVVLVGREGNLTSLIKEKIAAHQLEKCVQLVGHRKDVSELLAAADIFVFPSRFEGLPGALIEAEAAGLPIICTDIPNNREVADENVNALLFPVNDAQRLADCIKQLAHLPLSVRMGKESLRIFKERFGLEKIHQQMEQLFNRLTESRK